MDPEVLSETTEVPSGAKEVSREAAEEVSSMVGEVSRLVIP